MTATEFIKAHFQEVADNLGYKPTVESLTANNASGKYSVEVSAEWYNPELEDMERHYFQFQGQVSVNHFGQWEVV